MRYRSEIQQRIRQLRQEAYEYKQDHPKLNDIDVQKGKKQIVERIQELEWVLEQSEWRPEENAPPISKPLKEMFGVVRNPQAPIALLSAYFEDHPAAVVSFIEYQGEQTLIQPLFIEVTKHNIDRIRDGGGNAPDPLEPEAPS